MLDELRRVDPELDRDLGRWAEHWRSPSAPGTDPARLDDTAWASLRDHLDTALREFEAERSRALAAEMEGGRFATGPGQVVPDRYRRLVEAYYRGLATGDTPVAPAR